MVSSHWSNIDPECRVPARFYPMRMKPAKYLYHVEMPDSATRGAAVMPAPAVGYSDYDVFLENDEGSRVYRCKKLF